MLIYQNNFITLCNVEFPTTLSAVKIISMSGPRYSEIQFIQLAGQVYSEGFPDYSEHNLGL